MVNMLLFTLSKDVGFIPLQSLREVYLVQLHILVLAIVFIAASDLCSHPKGRYKL